ncbi:MAG TPA: exodeoxyribonuclease VII small subunit [Candidatus Barnesiella excrementigallinarum]|nr:exodeoxyribonuclease VII small subunit [Candidatus Barnesiella excrementigallinarum]
MTSKSKPTYAEAVAELEGIIKKLQNNEYEIDELQKCTARSLELLKFCKAKLFETDEELQKILNELNE